MKDLKKEFENFWLKEYLKPNLLPDATQLIVRNDVWSFFEPHLVSREQVVREFANELIETFENIKVDPKTDEDERVVTEGFAIDMALTEMTVSIIKECLDEFLQDSKEEK